MTYEQWERVKDECHNAKMIAFCGLSKEAQEAIQEAMRLGVIIEFLETEGTFIQTSNPAFWPGRVYRISPAWPGPAKPEPVAEYEDLPVIEKFGHYVVELETTFRAISVMHSFPRFAGHVMPDGRIRPRLIFDQQKDGTYRLRVPKAVRMV